MTVLRYQRTRRTVAGKSRYINFAQDEKGKIVSWGFWNHQNNKQVFLDGLKDQVRPTFRSGNIRLVLTCKYSSPKGHSYYFMGEAFLDITYEIKEGDEDIIKMLVENAFENNEVLLDMGINMFNDFAGVPIPYDSVECRIADHSLENAEDSRSVDIRVYVRGLDKTNVINTLDLEQAVEGILDELEV